MSNIYGTIELVANGENIFYVLSALIDVKNNERCMCSLAFYEDYGGENEKMLELWDNDEYLIETLLPTVIIPWIEGNKVENPGEFSALLKINGVDLKDFPSLKELIEKGIEMGLFEEYYKKKENE
jgi:hypothetical protein